MAIIDPVREAKPAASEAVTSPIAVIGSGVMGAGIAQVAASSGAQVMLYDVRRDAAAHAIANVHKNFQKLVAKERMTPEDAGSAASRLVIANSLRELANVTLIVEAITEDLDAKRALFRDLEDTVDAECILATNTSSLSITAIAAGLKHPGRVVGMHFFNPAPVMQLVEVVSGLTTERKYAAAVFATAAKWGKTPVHVRSTPGFIVNRIARPYYGEALRILAEGAADPASIDAVLRDAGGFPMGPFELMDLIGNDVNFAVTRSIYDAYFGDPRFTPSLIQQELVEAGRLGRKSGRGFFEYGDNALRPEPHIEPPVAPPRQVMLCGADPLVEGLAARFSAAGIKIIREPCVREPEGTIKMDGAAAALTDGRTATELAAATRVCDFIVFDLALDFANTNRIAMAKALQCSERGFQSVAGLFQAGGFSVTRFRDVAGLAVMRTVAMLANEAADAVNQGVSDANAVNTAMEKGVNYPHGPLAWADAIGIRRVETVLAHLAEQYGEDRYRVSPLIRQLVLSGGKFADVHLE